MKRVAVLVSGGGTNLQALLESEARGENPNGKIVLVVASKPGVYALERAANFGVESAVVARKEYADSEAFDTALLDTLQSHQIDVVVLAGFTRGPKEPAQAPVTAALVSAGDYGTTQISLSAIDAMVQRHCKANVKIREVTSVISLQEGGVGIQLKLSLLNDANIPETTEALRTSLRENIESLTGIQVRDVSIMVVNTPAQQGSQK